MKRTAASLLALITAVAMAFPAVAADAGWKMDENRNEWTYLDKRGDRIRDAFERSGNYQFYLGDDGLMVKDALIEYRDNLYYVDEKGVMVTNRWLKTEYEGEEGWIFFQNTGKAIEKGWHSIDGKKYHFTDYLMDTGWFKDDNDRGYWLGGEDEGWVQEGWQWLDEDDDEDKTEGWYYIESSGKYITGKEKKIKGATYFFDDEGLMLGNWVAFTTDKGTGSRSNASRNDLVYKFYDNDSGARAEGWMYLEDIEEGEESDRDSEEGWYYFKNGRAYDSKYKTSEIADGYGIARINGKYYCFDNGGKMVTGVVDGYDGEYYYFEEKAGSTEGQMKTGKVRITDSDDLDDEEYYYFEKSGTKKGRAYSGVKDGYLYEDGKLIKAEDESYEIVNVNSGKTYVVNKSGKIKKSGTFKIDDERFMIVGGSESEGYEVERK